MNVLVVYASRHGATKAIADRVAAVLERDGLAVTVRPAESKADLGEYDAYVVGSAAYMGHWLKEAAGFVRRNRDDLAGHPLWLFSSGPVGTDTVDAKGRDVVEASRPQEFAEFATLQPRDERVFFGAFDPEAKPVGMAERLGSVFMRMPAVRAALPAGDFRDWTAIESWAEGVASALRLGEAAVAATDPPLDTAGLAPTLR